MPWTTPITLTPCTQRQSLTVVSHTVRRRRADAGVVAQARGTRRSASNVASASASTDVGSVTSVTMPRTSPQVAELGTVAASSAGRLDVGDHDLHAFGEERARQCPSDP